MQTGREHWHALLRARAIENQCYVLAPDQWGYHFPGRASYGQSVAYDPWGRMLGCAPERECAFVVELDMPSLEGVRAKMRVIIKRILRKHGYPPDMQEAATKLVLEQAEVICGELAA